MRTDDNSASLDRFDDEGDEPELLGFEGPETDALDRADDPDAEPDDDLIEAELGAHDIDVDNDTDEDDALDDDPADDENDLEMALLQDLGIDLDSPDTPGVDLGAGLDVDDAPDDDEVAA